MRNRVQRIALAVALVALCVPRPSAAEPEDAAVDGVQVRARAEAGSVLIGDPFRYVVEVVAPPGAEVEIPILAGSVGLFTIVDFGDEPTRREGEGEGARVVVTRWYTLVTFETGEPFVPPIEVRYRDADGAAQVASSNSVSVRVESLLEREPGASDIRDIKPPEPVPFDWSPYLVLAGLILAAMAAIAGIVWLLRRRRRPIMVVRRPAHEVALEALAALQRQGLVEAGEIAAFYVGLTNIVRIYLEDGLHLRAPEMTTEEFLATAGVDPRLSPKQRRILGDFLSQADLVKFARAVPTPRDCEAAFDAAQRFVEETRPRSTTSKDEVRHAAA